MSNFILAFTPYFKKSVINELKKIDSKVEIKTQIEDGLFLFSTQMKKDDFLKKFQKSKPIFAKHIAPAVESGKLSGEIEKDKKQILTAILDLAKIESGEKFCVQTRIVTKKSEKPEYTSKDIEVFVGKKIEKDGGIPTFSQKNGLKNENIKIISIFVFDKLLFVGFSTSEQNLNFNCDDYRVCSRSARVISRAENKLIEALNKFDLKIDGGKALDIGAAPGGWTNVLISHGFDVVSVDPGKLNPALENHPKVKHLKCKIEDLNFDEKFDLIVNDMNVDPYVTGEIMNKLSKHLKPKGKAIVTIKLPGNPDNGVAEGVAELSKNFILKNVTSLFHNRREVTAFCEKK